MNGPDSHGILATVLLWSSLSKGVPSKEAAATDKSQGIDSALILHVHVQERVLNLI